MKTTSLLTMALAGLLALASARPQVDEYASIWGQYGDATVITGPTNVDEFGMPIVKKTDAPEARGMGNNGFNQGSDNGNSNNEHFGGVNAAQLAGGEGKPKVSPGSWTGVGAGNQANGYAGMPTGQSAPQNGNGQHHGSE